ncbi:MAG: hypothetical protein AB8C46_24650 [Burkholderiaceae bacterium]
MSDVLVLGVTHYPPLSMLDADMAGILRRTLQDPAIPEELKDSNTWPEEMQAEWSDDQAVASAAAHREALVEGLRRVRRELDEFSPDVVLIWGDDQHENFHEDLIPPYSVLCYDDLALQPWAQTADSAMMAGKPNVWDEPADLVRTIRGAPKVGRQLVEALLNAGFDTAYAYKPLHHPGLAHAFLNTVLYLDYDRTGFEWPVIAMPINCYGRKVVGAKGFMTSMADDIEPDPPSPAPKRLHALGAAVGRFAADSNLRVALVASSSWSHAFLVDHTYRLRPDTPADLRLYEALASQQHAPWLATSLTDIEQAGQQELLNWFTALGAVDELGLKLGWSSFVETACFNSNKVFAVWR